MLIFTSIIFLDKNAPFSIYISPQFAPLYLINDKLALVYSEET